MEHIQQMGQENVSCITNQGIYSCVSDVFWTALRSVGTMISVEAMMSETISVLSKFVTLVRLFPYITRYIGRVSQAGLELTMFVGLV